MGQLVQQGERTRCGGIVVVDDDEGYQIIGQRKTAEDILADIRMMRTDIAAHEDIDARPFGNGAEHREQRSGIPAAPLLLFRYAERGANRGCHLRRAVRDSG